MKRALGLVLTLALVLAGVALAKTSDQTLHGIVGPGFSIGVLGGGGAAVTHVDAGAVELEVEDLASAHSFHLTGPGNVDVATTIAGIGTKTFNLTLVDGTYSFFCDAHPLTMKGSFTVGNVTAPPPPPPPPPPPRHRHRHRHHPRRHRPRRSRRSRLGRRWCSP